MAKIKDTMIDKGNEEIEFAEKERDHELWSKCNGLHSGTKIHSKRKANGDVLETHWHPERKEIVIMRTWWVGGGDGDVMPEFEVVTSFDKVNDFILYANRNA